MKKLSEFGNTICREVSSVHITNHHFKKCSYTLPEVRKYAKIKQNTQNVHKIRRYNATIDGLTTQKPFEHLAWNTQIWRQICGENIFVRTPKSWVVNPSLCRSSYQIVLWKRPICSYGLHFSFQLNGIMTAVTKTEGHTGFGH